MRTTSNVSLLTVTALITLASAVPALSQSPYPITPLALEGDVVLGVGNITRIDNLAVNSNGDWLVEADTDNANADTDVVLLLNGAVLLREGDPLADPPGGSLDTFDSVNINVHGDSGWNFFIAGPPSDQDSGLFFNDTLVIQEGDASTAPEFSSHTPYVGFFDAKLNDLNTMAVVASVDDPAIPGTVDRALVLVEVDNAGALLSESVLAKEGDVLPGQTAAVVEIGTGPHLSAINDAGQVLFFVDTDGPTSSDGVIYLDTSILAQEGDPSPVPGRNFEFLSSRAMDLNNHGDAFFKANLDGATTDDELLLKNSTIVAREGASLPAIGGFAFTSFGASGGPVQIDDERNTLWYGDWDDPNTDVDTGLFLNELMLVQEGVTMIGGLTVDTIAGGQDAFALSDDGHFIVFEAVLQDGTEGAFMIEVTPPPPVPDGAVVPGAQSLAGKNVNGTDVDVSWDAASCPADDYNLMFGNLSGVSSLGYTGAVCGLGTGGSASFTPPAGDVFWIVVGVDDMSIEGSHGFDSDGAPRIASAGGQCGVVAQVNGSDCVP